MLNNINLVLSNKDRTVIKEQFGFQHKHNLQKTYSTQHYNSSIGI